ncbi:MAG: efflux RND transporter periplasmic adaptor subunit [Lentisphaerae bacterium]|nr:efflux RND transporter periplasmic adaptor subunit [Lentisphaerota bacterium]
MGKIMLGLKTCLLSAVAGTLLLTVGGCAKKAKKEFKERETRVTVQELEQRTFRERIPLQGIISPKEYAMISAKISGTLELLKVSEGDRRKAGDVLFGIDRQVLKNQVVVKEDEIKVKEAALQSANFALKTAEINQRQAKLDYDRALTLRDSRAISQANFETTETAFKKAEMDVRNAQADIINAKAQLKQSQSNLAIAKKNLDDSVIRAPFDCVVFETFVEENEYVTVGKNIMKLENPGSFEIVCYISSVYYDRINVGKTAVEFADSKGNLQRCVVTYKAPGIDSTTRTFKIKAVVPQNISVVSGMLCELNIILSEKVAYGLPSDAVLLRANNRYIVFTVGKDNRAESVEVTPGIVDGNACEIVNAAEVLGKKFVTTGQTFINNGSLLKFIKR